MPPTQALKHLWGPTRRSLLLLPPPPAPPTYAALKAAYGSSLFSVIRDITRSTSDQASSEKTILEIALPCPHLYSHSTLPRAALYPPTQRLLATLYKLICVISAQESIDSEDADRIDARVLLLSYPRDGRLDAINEGRPESDMQGPIIDIGTLARSNRPWHSVYSVETESGEQLLKNFTSKGNADATTIQRVRGGIVGVTKEDEKTLTDDLANASYQKRHYSVAVGGTFDHLHIGHKLLLTMTAFVLEGADVAGNEGQERSLTIGLTGDELLKKKKFAEFLESWDMRQTSTDEFMRSILDFSPQGPGQAQVDVRNEPGPNGHAVHVKLVSDIAINYVEIWDPFGPTITDEAITTLVLSGETRSGGEAVNSKRAERDWAPLDVFEVDVLDLDEEEASQQKDVEQGFQNKLSSTEIRRQQSIKVQATSDS